MDFNWHTGIECLFSSKSNKTIKALNDVGINTLLDLIWVLPRKISPIHKFVSKNFMDGSYLQLDVKVLSSNISPSRKRFKNINLQNITLNVQDLESKQILQLKWFNAYPNITTKVKNLEYLNIFGKLSIFNGTLQIINPELGPKEKYHLHIEYPTVNTISGNIIKKLISKIPKKLWYDIKTDVINSKSSHISLSEAFMVLHGKEDQKRHEESKLRLIYEEFYIEQLQLLKRRNQQIKSNFANNFCGQIDSEKSLSDFQNKVPFLLTNDQKNAIREIIDDINHESFMMRMLQGDVGCGKTLVAFAAAFAVKSLNKQTAIMCPTEALAQQHYKSAKEIFSCNEICLLTSSSKGRAKEKANYQISSNEFKIIIGTHSLIQDKVSFSSLSLIIIDEQHKFGVHQRVSLAKKAKFPNILLMSATPIPRSLSLTQFGDLKMTIIKEKPNGRKKISSRIIRADNFSLFLNFLNTRISMKEQAYVVVPAIEDNEEFNIQNIEKTHSFFIKTFPNLKIKILHGKLNSIEKEIILTSFQQREFDILISTSVIEVGIDNPNATVMCVFGPERFGLSSLHQLRGRVGRGGRPGFFFMIEEKKLSKDGLKRLSVIENCEDGFKIAEEDLLLRGEGDILGKVQSGNKNRKIANIVEHQNILHMVIQDINEINVTPDMLNKIPESDEVIFTI